MPAPPKNIIIRVSLITDAEHPDAEHGITRALLSILLKTTRTRTGHHLEMGRGVSIAVYDVVSSEILVSSALLGDADSNVCY